jgi:hypothetical protein
MVAIMTVTTLMALAILYFGRKNIRNKVETSAANANTFH